MWNRFLNGHIVQATGGNVASFEIDTRGAATGGEPTTKTRQARVYVDALEQITNANFIY